MHGLSVLQWSHGHKRYLYFKCIFYSISIVNLMVLKKNESKEVNIMLGSMGSWSHLYIIENLGWAHWAHGLMIETYI